LVVKAHAAISAEKIRAHKADFANSLPKMAVCVFDKPGGFHCCFARRRDPDSAAFSKIQALTLFAFLV
jgi:hypothetical protein